jgi:hypothetical protein
MVALDLGVSALPQALAAAGLGLGAALVARQAWSKGETRLWPLLLCLGLVDGLGMADTLARLGAGQGEMISALFGAAAGTDAMLVIATTMLAGVSRLLSRVRLRPWVVTATGGIAIAVAMASVTAGLGASGGLQIDQSDRMAALRFDFRSGGGTLGTGRAAPPRRLEDAAMAFLTVEPMEVRIEILLRLLDFIDPLRIDGGPTSVVPIQVQGEIAARARQMVEDTLSVVIDGREAVPILARTDFVTVAATGVTTREEPRPEPLHAVILGVTLAYGVDRPPSEISASWSIFPTPTTVVPAVWTDPTGSDRV